MPPLKNKNKKRRAPSDFEENFTGTESDLSRIIRGNVKYFPYTRVNTPEEAAQRIADLFEDCYENGNLPTVEKIALCLGINNRILWEWEHEESKGKEMANIVKRAKSIIAAIDGEAVSLGVMNTVAYIFRAKNFYSMTDNATIEVRATPALGETADRGEIAQQLLRSIGTTLTAQASDYPAGGQATIGQPSDYSVDGQATIASDYSAGEPATMPSDYQPETPSDYQTTIPGSQSSDYQATIAAALRQPEPEIVEVKFSEVEDDPKNG